MSTRGLVFKKEFASEFLGTFSLVLAGAGVVALTSLTPVPFSLVIISATFGIVVALAVLLGGRVSGAHIDPAISLAFAICGRMKRSSLLPYIFFQALGALAAGVTLRLVFAPSMESRFLGSTLLAPGISATAGILIEFAGTFTLSGVALSVSAKFRSLKPISLAMAMTLFVLILAMAPYTSASLNPARSLGPALASGHLDNLGVYLVGPTSGGAFAGIVFRKRVAF